MKKDTSLSITIILLSLFATVSGCGDVKTSSYFTPPKSKLDKYEALEIFDFESAIPDFPKDALKKIPDDIEKLLKAKENTFEEVKHGEIDDIAADKILVLLGEIAEFVPGTDVKFEGGALKFGEVTISLKLALLEKDTGKEITTGEISSFSSLGIFRSGHVGKDMYEIIAQEIVKFISENY